jgi:hypothetical protein
VKGGLVIKPSALHYTRSAGAISPILVQSSEGVPNTTATGVVFYPRSVGTAHHAYHRYNQPGADEFEAKAANSFTLIDKPGSSNPVSIKPTPYGISARRVANVVEFEERQLAPKLEAATTDPSV